eukprot:TRINITY_DN12540_c0_g1_i1.p1 TRINITY_DN12540_c0_g1~~TRINITY_DN12540_c0_g1_i1.p1  ORF type:complete len:646 (+),score=136.39 TRINITY_DN12540_c0_g1_i1:127-2064(+)
MGAKNTKQPQERRVSKARGGGHDDGHRFDRLPTVLGDSILFAGEDEEDNLRRSMDSFEAALNSPDQLAKVTLEEELGQNLDEDSDDTSFGSVADRDSVRGNMLSSVFPPRPQSGYSDEVYGNMGQPEPTGPNRDSANSEVYGNLWQQEPARRRSDVTHVAEGDYSEINPDAPKVIIRRLSDSHMSANPWQAIQRKTQRPAKRVSGSLSVLLDNKARQSPWYCLAFERSSAVGLLEENLDKLAPGAFVLVSSGLSFATLCMVAKGKGKTLVNIPIVNKHGTLQLEMNNVPQPPTFSHLSALIDFYSQKKQKGLTAALKPDAIQEHGLLSLMRDVVGTPHSPIAPEEPTYDLGTYTQQPGPPRSKTNTSRRPSLEVIYDVGSTPMPQKSRPPPTTAPPQPPPARESPPAKQATEVVEDDIPVEPVDYDLGTAPVEPVYGVHEPERERRDTEITPVTPVTTPPPASSKASYQASAHQASYNYISHGMEDMSGFGTAMPDPGVGDDGFITISEKSFGADGPIRGVCFEPLQLDEWFFIGLSNMETNYHNRKDCHYDDIDFCIFVQSSGRLTAREAEDEVGPKIEYNLGDLLGIVTRFNKKTQRHMVHYQLNGRTFYTSTREPRFPLHVDQAFHPGSLKKKLVTNVKWLS